MAQASKDKGGTVTVRQVASAAGRFSYQRATLKGLGLDKINRVRTLEDTPEVRGMIARVHHLVLVVGSEEDASDNDYETIELPEGTRIAKQNIIAPPHAITADKERWFPKGGLKHFTQKPNGRIEITISKEKLRYRDMLRQST